MQLLRQRMIIVSFLVASEVVAGIDATTSNEAGAEQGSRRDSLLPHLNDIDNISVSKRSHTQTTGDGRHSRKKIQSDAEEEDDDRKMVKIDISALRSHFPGLAFYNQESLTPNVLQVDIPSLRANAESDLMWPSTRFVHYSPHLDRFTYPNNFEVPYDLVATDDADERMVHTLPLPYLSHLSEGNNILLLPSSQSNYGKIRSISVPQSASLKEWRSFPPLEDYKAPLPYRHPLHEEGEDALYDFLADIPDVNTPVSAELMSLTDNLPLGEEMIVPLDWEENILQDYGTVKRLPPQKRHVFVSQGWKPGGYAASSRKPDVPSKAQETRKESRKDTPRSYNSLFGSSGWRPGRKRDDLSGGLVDGHRRLIDRLGFVKLPSFVNSIKGGPPANVRKNDVKKNVFFSKGWGPGGRPLSEKFRDTRKITPPTRKERNVFDNSVIRTESQQSWELPRQQWSIPHLFGPYW